MDVRYRVRFELPSLPGLAATVINVQEDERVHERVGEAVLGYLRAVGLTSQRLRAEVKIVSDAGGGEVYQGTRWMGQFQLERMGRR